MHDSDHYDVNRIFVGLFWELHRRIVCLSDGGQPTSVSLLDCDHEGVVRIFVARSCKLWGYLINYIRLDYVAQFFLTRSVITLHYAAQIFPYQECNYLFIQLKVKLFNCVWIIRIIQYIYSRHDTWECLSCPCIQPSLLLSTWCAGSVCSVCTWQTMCMSASACQLSSCVVATVWDSCIARSLCVL